MTLWRCGDTQVFLLTETQRYRRHPVWRPHPSDRQVCSTMFHATLNSPSSGADVLRRHANVGAMSSCRTGAAVPTLPMYCSYIFLGEWPRNGIHICSASPSSPPYPAHSADGMAAPSGLWNSCAEMTLKPLQEASGGNVEGIVSVDPLPPASVPQAAHVKLLRPWLPAFCFRMRWSATKGALRRRKRILRRNMIGGRQG